MNEFMHKDAKIYVAGHRGLVGSAICRRLQENSFHNIVVKSHADLDLTDQAEVREFFRNETPDYVILAAAKVGGIHANNTYPAEFIQQNLAIQTNIIHEAWRSGVNRLLFLGSSCIYPRDCAQPIREEYLLTGPLEPTNRPYALAKIAGVEMCWSYNRQNGAQFLSVMPTNLYGPGDNYHPENSHVIPSLIRRFHEAKINNKPEVVIWGSGTPRREFLYVDDMANACIQLLNLPDSQYQSLLAADRNDGLPPIVNLGAGEDLTIAELARIISETVKYQGRISFDPSKPDGTPRKLLDSSRMNELGIEAITDLRKGLALAYENFRVHFSE